MDLLTAKELELSNLRSLFHRLVQMDTATWPSHCALELPRDTLNTCLIYTGDSIVIRDRNIYQKTVSKAP